MVTACVYMGTTTKRSHQKMVLLSASTRSLQLHKVKLQRLPDMTGRSGIINSSIDLSMCVCAENRPGFSASLIAHRWL